VDMLKIHRNIWKFERKKINFLKVAFFFFIFINKFVNLKTDKKTIFIKTNNAEIEVDNNLLNQNLFKKRSKIFNGYDWK